MLVTPSRTYVWAVGNDDEGNANTGVLHRICTL